MSVSSNLQSKPSWLDTFPDEDVAFGFDEGGMWFSGNASDAPYPVRTNYDIDSDTTVVVTYTFIHANVDAEDGSACPDQGICFFKADVEPYWSWGDDASRIAVQYNCGHPIIEGQDNNSSSAEYNLTIGNTYTARVTYNPVEETITHELFDGGSASGEPVDTFTLTNERLPAGAYRIGFHADLDTGVPDKAYFIHLEISEDPPVTFTNVFRALRLPHRRREVVSEEDNTPVNVPPGELLYDENNNKLYIGGGDGSATEFTGSGGGGGSFDQSLNTTDNVTFNNVQVDNYLRFKADAENTDTFYIAKDSAIGNVSVLQVVLGDDGTSGANVNNYYPVSADGPYGLTDYVAFMSTGGSTYHLFGTDGQYFNAGGIVLANGTKITVGTFDNGTGNSGGISLHCGAGYELNWQGGRLRSTADSGVTAATIYVESPLEFPGAGYDPDNMQIDSAGLTFPDGTTQTTATPALATVATSGSYNDLTDLPTLFDGSYNSLTNLPDLTVYAQSSSLATVATSGSYNDLTNLPDLTVYATTSSLATVATSGSYNDLTNLPTLFDGSYNSLTDLPDLTVYATTSSLATVATSGSYNDLTDLPDLTVYATTSSLATVATSGSYDDLSNLPTAVYALTATNNIAPAAGTNTVSGGGSTIAGGENNTADGAYSSVLGGQHNDINEQANAHIIGSYITADAPDTTYVEGFKTKGPITEGVVAIGSSGTTQTLALTTGTVQTCTLSDNCTFTMPTAVAGRSFTLFLTQGASAYTATFTGVKWPAGTAPTISTASGAIDILSFVSDGTNWYGVAVQEFS